MSVQAMVFIYFLVATVGVPFMLRPQHSQSGNEDAGSRQ